MAVLSAARALYRPRVLSLARQGLSATAIRDKLIGDFGRAYRWQNLLTDVRFAKLGTFERPDLDQVFETRLNQRARYRIIGTATVQDKTTGEFSQRTVSVYTNQRYSQEEADDYFRDIQGQRSYTQDVDWISFQPDYYEHQEGLSY